VTLAARREAEVGVYRGLYAGPDYGKPTRRHDGVRLMMTAEVARLRPASWLDVGSGAVDYSDLFPGIRREDPAFGGLMIHRIDEAGVHDVVTCFDVLEHLLPEDLERAPAWLLAVTGRALYVSVGAFPSIWNCRRLHLTVRSPAEWDAWAFAAFGMATTKMPDLQKQTPCWRIGQTAPGTG